MYTIKIKGIEQDATWDNYESCYDEARFILNNSGAKFCVIYLDNITYTILIKKGYNAYNFNQFNQFDKNCRIVDFFILNQNGSNNYYIKTKN